VSLNQAKLLTQITPLKYPLILFKQDGIYGLGNFYNGKQGKAETGLEISTLAIVDVGFNTAYHVSTRQTPVKTKDANGSRVTAYFSHFKTDCHALPKDIRYLVTDAYYSKQQFTNGLLGCGYHPVGKLRCDANLRHLYTGEQKAKGRHRRYTGKLVIGDVSQPDYVGEKDGVKVYTAIVNCVNLKRDIRLVYLLRHNGYAVLFSTDTELEAMTLHRYYQARFQIEFLFRDAKQFTGLNPLPGTLGSGSAQPFQRLFHRIEPDQMARQATVAPAEADFGRQLEN
jgi:hypothetical protein